MAARSQNRRKRQIGARVPGLEVGGERAHPEFHTTKKNGSFNEPRPLLLAYTKTRVFGMPRPTVYHYKDRRLDAVIERRKPHPKRRR